jgi:hypothetical protein
MKLLPPTMDTIARHKVHICEKCIDEIHHERKPYTFELESGRIVWLCRKCAGNWTEILTKEFEVWIND